MMEMRNRIAGSSSRILMILAALTAFCLLLTLHSLWSLLPPSAWGRALAHPDVADISELLVHYSLLPRVCTALLTGAGLSLSAVLLQAALRNPVAEPSTLGVSAGAFVALSFMTVATPAFAEGHRLVIALGGGLLAALATLALAWRRQLSAEAVLMAGLIVNLYAGALNTVLILFHGGLVRLFIWGSGSLATQDWSAVQYLLPQFFIAGAVSLLLIRPLSVLSLSDDAAVSLGLSPARMRLVAIVLAVWLAASSVSAVGIIGFVGLCAPEIVRRAGLHQIKWQLLLSPILGALLLWLADQIFQVLPLLAEIPAGASIAIIGAPLLFWYTQRVRQRGTVPELVPSFSSPSGLSLGATLWLLLAALALLALSLFVGRGLSGWNFGLSSLDATLFWRGPRLVVAVAGGALLAIAGVIVQRLLANPLASPETLGISSGSALAMILAIVLFPAAPRWMLMLAAGAGAGLVLAGLLASGFRHAFAPDRLLMIGISIATIFSAIISVLMGTGDPKMLALIGWLNGSTYMATPLDAALATALVAIAALLLPLLLRWLDILSLGGDAATSLGVPLALSRGLLLLYASLLIGASVLVTGPLTFVGLLAPHLARSLGARSAAQTLLLAAMIGAATMGFADLIGRVALVPRQLPTGLVATLIGGGFFMLRLGMRG